ncbi:chaperonin-containing T-complex member BBS12 [Ambystoma mexicanum]|uniref:chaperonin-containing T-complex member BBS12 n=1 Tax=Ambystoma mexicanum TaxID=8296 RepID=UPI0037E955BA
MNIRRHVGLQQLSLLAASGRTLLGPVKSLKFIVDESTQECALSCSAFRLLESLDLTSAVGQLLNETVQIHNKTFRTGTSTLLFLVGAWSNSALECLSQGIPLSMVVSIMSEGLTSCIEEVKSFQIPLHDIWKQTGCKSPHSDDGTSRTPQRLCQKKQMFEGIFSQQTVTHGPCGSNAVFSSGPKDFQAVVQHKHLHQSPRNGSRPESRGQRIKLTHSRHFQIEPPLYDDSPLGSSQAGATESTGISCDWRGLEQLTEGLSHGNFNCMTFVRDAAKHLCREAADMINGNSTSPMYNVSKIVSCCLPGLSHDHSCVHSGYVTLVSPEQAAVAVHLQQTPLQVLVVEGDLTEKYRHLGYNTASCIKTVSDGVPVPGNGLEDSWTNNAFSQITQSNVNLILVTGIVSVDLMQQLIPSDVLAISHVHQNVIKAFCEATGANPVTYLAQVSRCHMGTGACVSVLKTDNLNPVELGHRVPIVIKATNIPLVTAVLSTPLTSRMQAMEDQFWTCAHRLQNALADQNVFLGGGAVELLCLRHLEKLEQCSTGKDQTLSGQFHNPSSWLATSSLCYTPCVLRAMADGWYKYLSSVMYDTMKCTSCLDGRTFIQTHLHNLATCNSPSAYLHKEFIKEENSFISVEFPCKLGDNLYIYDNVTAKEEAWRRALDVVLLVLQTDHEILTGSSTQTLFLSSDEGASECQHL